MIDYKEEHISVCDFCSHPVDPYKDSMYITYNQWVQYVYCQPCAEADGLGHFKTNKWTIIAGDKI